MFQKILNSLHMHASCRRAGLRALWVPLCALQCLAAHAQVAPVTALANLALGQPTSQSSTGFGGVPSLAVDGNTDGNYLDNSVTSTGQTPVAQEWWQVDLGRVSTINQVVLWNRTDCCASRLQNFDVLISPTDMTGRTLAQLTADPSVTVQSVASLTAASLTLTFPSTQGRYVRVQLTGTGYLSLAEVQVLGVPTGDLALGRPATQSSVLSAAYPPTNATDGKVDGNFLDGSVTHTNLEAQPWWQVDLGTSVYFDRIRIWNRTDCCAARLQNFVVFVSATDMTGQTLAQLQANPAVSATAVAGLSGANAIDIPVAGSYARFVRIELTGTDYLSLAEVQVLGGVDSDLARGKTATASSILIPSYPPALAVDGDNDGNFLDGSVMHTAQELEPWWQVDLGAPSSIQNIQIFNRTDCCATRLQNFDVFVSSADMTYESMAALLADPTVFHVAVASLNGLPSITLPASRIGRFVRVQLTGTDYLSLAEVRVLGNASQPQLVSGWSQALMGPFDASCCTFPDFSGSTIRTVVRSAATGNQVQVRLSNDLSGAPVTIGDVHIAASQSAGFPSSAIVAGTDTTVTFGGSGSVTIPADSSVLSDPIPFAVSADQILAVSTYVASSTTPLTYHYSAEATTYVTTGDAASAPNMTTGTAYGQRFLLESVEVNQVAGGATIVCIGDSITDGPYIPPDTNLRWPDDLSNNLQANGLTWLSVIDKGIGGGRVLLNGTGPSLLSRFNRDALSIPGVKYIILYEGVNDIGLGATAASLEAAYPQLVAQAHALGIKVYGATITPFYGHSYYTAATEAVRQQVNAFIRTSGTFDAVLDFDAAIRDPAAPIQLLAAYDSGDHIHPSLVGLQALANAVNLQLLLH